MTIYMTKHGDWCTAVRVEEPEGTPVVVRAFRDDTGARAAAGLLADTLERLGFSKPLCVTAPPKPEPELKWDEW